MSNRAFVTVLILMFATAVGAGAVGGKLFWRAPANPPLAPKIGNLSDELGLNPEQSTKMQAIWQSASETSNACVDKAKKIQEDEDRTLETKILTSEEQRQAPHGALRKDSELQAQRGDGRAARSRLTKLPEQTRLILTADQWNLYRQIRYSSRTGALPDPVPGHSSATGESDNIARAPRRKI